jgi:hypothetical protein
MFAFFDALNHIMSTHWASFSRNNLPVGTPHSSWNPHSNNTPINVLYVISLLESLDPPLLLQ